MPLVVWFGGAIVLFALTLAGGCASKPKPVEPEPYIASYQSGMYQQAYSQAEAVAQGSGDSLEKDRAALMAGLAAYALRRPEQSEKWLIPLITHKDAEVSGTAQWTLGMIAQDRGNSSRGALLGVAAAEKLKGDDAARARILAGESYARLGRVNDAKEQFSLGMNSATDPGLRAAIESRLANPGAATGTATVSGSTGTVLGNPAPPAPAGQFVIQFGSFSDRRRAEQLAAEKSAITARAGLAPPRVVSTTDPKTGASLFAVQAGPFTSRAAAQASAARMGAGSGGVVMMSHR